MGRWYIERRHVPVASKLGMDLARHLYTRRIGKVIVVTHEPLTMLRVVRKQWMNILAHLQRERSSTLDTLKRTTLDQDINSMQSLRFTAKPLDETTHADIFFIEPTNLHFIPPACRTIYFVTAVDPQTYPSLTRHLAPDTLLVEYTEATSCHNHK